MWPDVRPAVFDQISSGKIYGGKTPVVSVPVARCPAVKWVDTVINALSILVIHAPPVSFNTTCS